VARKVMKLMPILLISMSSGCQAYWYRD